MTNRLCPICVVRPIPRLDTRNQRIWFCNECACYVDAVTGAIYDSDGVFQGNML